VPVPVPVVHVFTPSADPAATSVVVDDAAGARLAAEHLLDLGRRRIANLTGPHGHRSATARAQSAVAAVLAGGGTPAGEVQYGDWSERWGRHAAASLLRREPDVDGIVCGSDQIARGVCDGLREAGRRVPEDVAVTGYDNWDVMAEASRPPLTTVDLLLEELGRCAAGLLLDAIDGRPHPGVTSLAPRLVIRESTIGG
jgi:LacI family transcriptional regulator